MEKKNFNRKNSDNKRSNYRKPKPKKFEIEEAFDNYEKKRYKKKRFSDKKKYNSEDENQYSQKSKYKSRNFKNKKSKNSRNIESDFIRLNRYIANSGLCSRREADAYIVQGLVKVNDKVVTELGTKINKYKDIVKVNNKLIRQEKKVYVLLNKPKDFVTTVTDPHAEKTVMDLVINACDERIYPVGRLDKKTTGVLLLTNDGELTKQLTHPSYNKKKIYHVFLDKAITKADMERIIEGIELDDGFIQADQINYSDLNDKKQVGIELHSGKNRIVRRIFEYLGYKVIKLDRVYFAGLTKKGLQRGKWRLLTEKEIGLLKMGSYK